MTGRRFNLVVILVVVILLISSILMLKKTDYWHDESDDLNLAATSPITGNNTVLLDPLLRKYKPGVLAEIFMQTLHGSSVKKNESYSKDWSDDEQIDFGYVNGSYSQIDNTGIFKNVYYSTKSKLYKRPSDNWTAYMPRIIIEGNTTIGCALIQYSNQFVSSEPHYVDNDQSKQEVESKIKSIINTLGLTLHGNESISYSGGYSPAYDSNFYFSGVQVYQGAARVDFQHWYGAGIKMSINADDEISGFSVCCWLDMDSIPAVLNRSEVMDIAMNYIDAEHDEYWKVGGIFGLVTNGHSVYYSGDLGVEKDLELGYRYLHITAVDGIISNDVKIGWQHSAAPSIGWKIKTDKKVYLVGEKVNVEFWLANYNNYLNVEKTYCVRTPPNDYKFNISLDSYNLTAPYYHDAPEDWHYKNVTIYNRTEVMVYNFTWDQTFQPGIFEDIPAVQIGQPVGPGTYWITSYMFEENDSHPYWRQWSRKMITIE